MPEGTPSHEGSASVPEDVRGPVPELRDEQPPPPVMGKPPRDEQGSIVRPEQQAAAKREADMANTVARRVSNVVIETLRRHGVEVPPAAHVALIADLEAFVRRPAG